MSKFELYSPQVEDIHTLKQNGVAKILFGQYEGDWNGQYDSKGKLFFCPGFEGTREEGLRLILDRQLSPSVLGRSVFCESKLAYAIANGCKQYGQQVDYMYGEALYKPEMKEGNPIRLYSLDEITEIFCKLGLRICNSFADFSGKPSSDNDIQLMVYSIRE